MKGGREIRGEYGERRERKKGEKKEIEIYLCDGRNKGKYGEKREIEHNGEGRKK